MRKRSWRRDITTASLMLSITMALATVYTELTDTRHTWWWFELVGILALLAAALLIYTAPSE